MINWRLVLVSLCVVLISIPINSNAIAESRHFDLNMILITLDCKNRNNLTEFIGLIEISYLYLWSFGYQPVFQAYCLTPTEFVKSDVFYDDIKKSQSVVMFDYDLWSETSFGIFGYSPPDNMLTTSGTIFFDDKLILMSFSLLDDLNSQILTHELMHFVFWEKGYPEDVYINKVHEDWKVYKEEYKDREKNYSTYAKKYYYIFG